jgi:hypothetical protein
MTNLALALAAALVLGSTSVGFAGEGSPDHAVPSKAEYYGIQTVAPLAARTAVPDASLPTFDAAAKAWLERASRAYNG